MQPGAAAVQVGHAVVPSCLIAPGYRILLPAEYTLSRWPVGWRHLVCHVLCVAGIGVFYFKGDCLDVGSPSEVTLNSNPQVAVFIDLYQMGRAQSYTELVIRRERHHHCLGCINQKMPLLQPSRCGRY